MRQKFRAMSPHEVQGVALDFRVMPPIFLGECGVFSSSCKGDANFVFDSG